MPRIYLDNAATTPTRPEVLAAMLPFYAETFANPSSAHSAGQRARRALQAAREKTAAALGASPDEIVFTASGSEADNLALFGIMDANAGRGRHLVISAIEHHAVLHSAEELARRGASVTVLPVDREGFVCAQALQDALTEQTVLVSIMHGNNEVGTIQRIAALADIAHARGALFHSDAVQTVGHVAVEVRRLGVDALSLSAHKFEGPKGVGALYVRAGVAVSPVVRGGGQESGRRSGTENLPAIVGLAAALSLAMAELDESQSRISALRDRLIAETLGSVPASALNGTLVERLPNNASIRFAGIEASTALIGLDIAGIEASTASACSSGSMTPSHVLSAMGLDAGAARGTIRFSLGRDTTAQHIDRLLAELPAVIARLRSLSDVLVGS